MMQTRRIYIIFHGRFPSEKAAAIFAAKSAESFADQGAKVTLLVPDRKESFKQDAFAYYNLKKNFDIVRLPIADLFTTSLIRSVAFRLSFVSFAWSCLWFSMTKGEKGALYYSNEILPLAFVSMVSRNTCYEMHDFPERNFFFYKAMFKRFAHILVHNRWKLEQLHKLVRIDHKKAFYEPNAVELKDFDISTSKADARLACGLPAEKTIIVYTGHLYGWKGVDTLAEAARLLSDDMLVVFVGGTQGDIEVFRKKYGNIKNIVIAGHKQHSEIALWQKAADILVLPNTAKENISKFYTSPMKLFEYMASKRPIVASRLPSIVEILSDANSFLCEPDSPHAFAAEFKAVGSDIALAERKAAQAYQDVLSHTWQSRAKRIFSIIMNNYE